MLENYQNVKNIPKNILENSQFLGNIPQIFWKIFNFRGIFPKSLGQFPILGEYSTKICGESFHNSLGRFPIFRKYSPNILENSQFLGNIPQIFRKISNFMGVFPKNMWWNHRKNVAKFPHQLLGKISHFRVKILYPNKLGNFPPKMDKFQKKYGIFPKNLVNKWINNILWIVPINYWGKFHILGYTYFSPKNWIKSRKSRKYSPNILRNFQVFGNIPQMFRKIFHFERIFPKYFGKFPIFRKYSPNILENFQF